MTAHPKPTKRILIANRAEIASRIIRTCKQLGIETVAVHSEVDKHLPYVSEADTAIELPSPTAYLSIDAIITACKTSGATAVHPGYGFLSENPEFPEALAKIGVSFIGPSSQNIRDLGNKAHAKLLAQQSATPTAPTISIETTGVQSNDQNIKRFVEEHGLPLLIKASAGGGGRGMRVVYDLNTLEESVSSASREAQAAFGNSEVFIEKFITEARHIEVQIAGDVHGNVVALGTRDCTVQRNNQKIIEEAPATNLRGDTERALCDAACRLAKCAGYTNLGTVEFLYTNDGSFYFLEVNTRLQVEHPVTEMTTGLDLVALQIHLTNGLSLPELGITNEAIASNGHAIEARICAEEFDRSFRPTTGTILELSLPEHISETGVIRADFGYAPCCKVTHYYDSLLGKLIVHAPDRISSIEALESAIGQLRISGVGTNKTLLHCVVTSSAFISQTHSVSTSEELFPTTQDLESFHFLANVIHSTDRFKRKRSSWYQASPWVTPLSNAPESYPSISKIGGIHYETHTHRVTRESFKVSQTIPYEDDMTFQILDHTELSAFTRRLSIRSNVDTSISATIFSDGDDHWIHLRQGTALVSAAHRLPVDRAAHETLESSAITSPLPATISNLLVRKGDRVEQGATLLVLDSMKMEHPILSPKTGIVKSLEIEVGSLVVAGQLLLTIE